jgi:hypothetical protein
MYNLMWFLNWSALAVVFWSTGPLSTDFAVAAPPLEFCPHRTPDQQLGATGQRPIGDGSCTPLVEKRDRSASEEQQPREVSIENLQGEVSAFLNTYNQFLQCCKTDLDKLETVEKLGDEVSDLLAAVQAGLFSEHMKLRGWTLRELLPPVLKARADLKTLRTQLEYIRSAREKSGELDYEDAAHVHCPPAPRPVRALGPVQVSAGQSAKPRGPECALERKGPPERMLESIPEPGETWGSPVPPALKSEAAAARARRSETAV